MPVPEPAKVPEVWSAGFRPGSTDEQTGAACGADSQQEKHSETNPESLPWPVPHTGHQNRDREDSLVTKDQVTGLCSISHFLGSVRVASQS